MMSFFQQFQVFSIRREEGDSLEWKEFKEEVSLSLQAVFGIPWFPRI